MSTATDYRSFLKAKTQLGSTGGFDPLWMPESAFPFQQSLCDWVIRKGRGALFADCGLGKTLMELTWAENVVRKTNRPVLILTPLAVSHQTCREAEKFGIECTRSNAGQLQSKIVTTNYERLHYFNSSDFAGVVCDESSALKNAGGKIRLAVTEFLRTIPYRLLGTATAAPNDFVELGTSSEALGELGYADMITRFFKEETIKDYLGWGRKTYKFRGHAEQPFWRWVCSWARSCRKPSDIGFSDSGFDLPPLIEAEHVVENSTPRAGMLFSTPTRNLQEQREERRVTIKERCEVAAQYAESHDGPSVLWCHLNAEGDLLSEVVKDCEQVSGSMSDESKEDKLLAFQNGQIKRLVIKPKIGCFGLNWQHCHNVITFPSHSFEQYYQAVRRCWRFGQKSPVTVTIVTTEGEQGVLKNLQRKAAQSEAMFQSLSANMRESVAVDDGWKFIMRERKPQWL